MFIVIINYLRHILLTGLSSWSLGGGGLAKGSWILLSAGKLSFIGTLRSLANKRPPLNSLIASVQALPEPYINVPSMYGEISFNYKQNQNWEHNFIGVSRTKHYIVSKIRMLLLLPNTMAIAITPK